MLLTLVPIVTLVRLVQFQNATAPMLMTLLEIITLVRLRQNSNALVPMAVTGSPLMLLGMDAAPLGQLGYVMVIAPLFVVYENWACPKVGSANSTISGSSALRRVFMPHSVSSEKAASALLHACGSTPLADAGKENVRDAPPKTSPSRRAQSVEADGIIRPLRIAEIGGAASEGVRAHR